MTGLHQHETRKIVANIKHSLSPGGRCLDASEHPEHPHHFFFLFNSESTVEVLRWLLDLDGIGEIEKAGDADIASHQF